MKMSGSSEPDVFLLFSYFFLDPIVVSLEEVHAFSPNPIS